MEKFKFPDGFKGIIFDCDGVMIDSEDGNRFFYNAVLGHFGLPPMNKAQENYAFMATATDALKQMIPPELHRRIPEAIEKSINYQRDILPRVKLMPKFREFIAYAHNLGLRMAIDTNRTSEGIQRVLDFFNLPNYFDPVATSSAFPPKPSPAGINYICKSWQAAQEQVLFIGDSENDRNTSRNAGCIFAAFKNCELRGDICISSYTELAEILWGIELS